MSAPPLRFWCVLGAVAMSLGWGLRGSIGGGPLGAMIPGAMIGLVLCLMLDRESDAGLIAAFAAIGVGFGGQETYGQTVGLSLQPETFWWAILVYVEAGDALDLPGVVVGYPCERDRVLGRISGGSERVGFPIPSLSASPDVTHVTYWRLHDVPMIA